MKAQQSLTVSCKMSDFDVSKNPFELIICRENEKRSNIVCQRFFRINKVDMHLFETMDFHQTFITCIQMIERALAEASSAFFQSNYNVICVKDKAQISLSQCKRDDVYYVTAEDCFYELIKGHLERITNDGRFWTFVPLKGNWRLDCSLFFNTPKGTRKLLSQAQIDLSKYPRHITTKIDLTGKREHWNQAKNLVYEIIHAICLCVIKRP